MRKLLLLLATAFVLTAGFTVVLTARYLPVESPVVEAGDVAVPKGAADRLASAVRIRTISADDAEAFDAASGPRAHARHQRAHRTQGVRSCDPDVPADRHTLGPVNEPVRCFWPVWRSHFSRPRRGADDGFEWVIKGPQPRASRRGLS
jgi:hypothetical protein